MVRGGGGDSGHYPPPTFIVVACAHCRRFVLVVMAAPATRSQASHTRAVDAELRRLTLTDTQSSWGESHRHGLSKQASPLGTTPAQRSTLLRRQTAYIIATR